MTGTTRAELTRNLAIGLAFVLLMSRIDLSIGAVLYLATCVLALALSGLPWPADLALVTVLATRGGVSLFGGRGSVAWCSAPS